jgi:hypothetical protein
LIILSREESASYFISFFISDKIKKGKREVSMKPTIKLPIAISISFIFLSVYAIENQNPQWKGTIEEETGVKVIKNPNEPLYGEITFDLEEDLSIGNEEDENYMFYRARMLAVDSEGNILVLDAGNNRIQKYDKDGKYLQSIGKQGQGPGEFDSPTSLYIDTKDNIYVSEMFQRLHIFDKNGVFQKRIKVEVQENMGVTRDGNFIVHILSRGERKSDMHGDYDRFLDIELKSQDGTTIKTIASYRSEMPGMIKTERGFTSPNNLCTPRLFLCPINEDLAIYGYSSDYSLFAINSKGETVYIIKKDEPPQSITKAEKDKVIDRRMRAQKENELMPQISRSKYESALRFPKHKPFYERIITDDKDRIYVEKFKFPFDRSDSADFDIFSKDGYYLYKAKIAIRYPQVIKSGCIYSTEYGQDTGYVRIKRYKIKNWEQIKEGSNEKSQIK